MLPSALRVGATEVSRLWNQLSFTVTVLVDLLWLVWVSASQ